MVFIITGSQGQGKTNFLKSLSEKLKHNKIQLKGFIALGTFESNLRSKFILEDVNGTSRELFCDTTIRPEDKQFGRFAFKPEGHDFGVSCLSGDEGSNKTIYVLDEIGKLETSGYGWHDSLKRLLNEKKDLIIAVRNLYLYEIVSYFGIENFRIINIEDILPEEVSSEISELIKGRQNKG